MTKVLRMWSKLSLLFELTWTDGVLTRNFVETTMMPAVKRWELRGIRELVVDPTEGHVPRHTPVTDPEFLQRLAIDLHDQFAFRYLLSEE